MLKILGSSQIRDVDRYTIEHDPVTSIELMERACRAFVDWFLRHVSVDKKIVVICGRGNNGGDGLGVARLLREWSYSLEVFVIAEGSSTEDFNTNLKRVGTNVHELRVGSELPAFDSYDVIIDAIFGSGLSRPVEGIFANVIDKINASSCTVVSIDIPTGLYADEDSSGTIVKADYTVAFQIPKLTFLLPSSYQFVGDWSLVDIGLDKSYIKSLDTSYQILQLKDCKALLKPRRRFDHKGTYGHALIIGGSFGKIGAVVLSAKAALRSGAGLVSAHIPRCGYEIMQTSLPEAMVVCDEKAEHISIINDISKYDTIGIGPGLGQHMDTVKALRNLLTAAKKPVVIDADALNILAEHSELLHLIPQESILTPHPKEFERLAGPSKNDFHRLEQLKTFSRKLNCYFILKGGYTAICAPSGAITFNPIGNPGMATGGTGDVLTGLLTGLLAQGYSPHDCCLLGVYLHGMAGDLAANELGMQGMIAGDLIDFIPSAYKKISR